MKKQNGLAATFLIGTLAILFAQEQTFAAGDEQRMALSPPPARAWVARYNDGKNKFDRARALAVDDSGNVYVTGSSADSNGTADYITIKYNNAGIKQWVRRYDGSTKLSDEAVAIALDAAGNVYVTGTSRNPDNSSTVATIKYNRAGAKQWVQRYNAPAVATAMAVDSSGNVYITGNSLTLLGSDYLIIKYNSAGAKRWSAVYSAAGLSFDEAHAIAVDRWGNVFVTGVTKLTADADYATIKYNPNGVQQWIAYHQWPGNGYDDARALAVDDSGNVYVTGESGGLCTCKLNYITIKYSPAGVKQWQRIYDGPEHLYDRPNAMAVDKAGNVYITGFSQDSTNVTYYATVKYNRAGDRKWAVRYKGPGNSNSGQALAVDGNGNVYVAGSGSGLGSGNDYVTIKYNGNGVMQWTARYNGPGNDSDQAAALALDQLGNIFVTGTSMNASANPDYATIKYVQSNASLAWEEIAPEEAPASTMTQRLPKQFDLLQNFPNPFSQIPRFAGNPSTTIRFDMPVAGSVKLTVYNLRGELVRTLVDGEMAAGYHHVAFEANHLASGVYFYRLEAGTYTMTRKMILQK